MPYKHGSYASLIPSGYAPIPEGVETIPVYLGTAPIQQLDLADNSSKINKAIKVSSFEDAKALIGYDDDWETFTLCEAIAVHFQSGLQNIGPIIVINALDPSTHKKSGTASLTFVDSVAYIDKPVILSTFAISGKVENTDYTITYENGRVKVTKITTIADGTSATFDEIDITKVTNDDIIDTLDEIDNVKRIHNLIPTIIASPGWSHIAAVATAMASKCATKISSKYETICVVDIDSGDSEAETIAEAIAWKSTNSYTSKHMKVCWPKVSYQGVNFWMSTLLAYIMQLTDYSNDNVPYISPSNKQIPIDGTVLGDGTEIIYDESKANLLNEVGITTANYAGGTWRVWGPHMGNYSYAGLSSINAEDRSDASIRTMKYLNNQFIIRFIETIDGPMTRRIIEGILVDAQQWLNSLVNEGKLLFGEIKFVRADNTDAEITDGNFVFDVGTTTTPVGKSITFEVQYNSTGLETLFGGEA